MASTQYPPPPKPPQKSPNTAGLESFQTKSQRKTGIKKIEKKTFSTIFNPSFQFFLVIWVHRTYFLLDLNLFWQPWQRCNENAAFDASAEGLEGASISFSNGNIPWVLSACFQPVAHSLWLFQFRTAISHSAHRTSLAACSQMGLWPVGRPAGCGH